MSEIGKDVVSLSRARADRSGDCRDWNARDALAEMLQLVDDGMKVEIIYIAAQVDTDDGKVEQLWKCAGGTKLELLGLLSRHMHLINTDV